MRVSTKLVLSSHVRGLGVDLEDTLVGYHPSPREQVVVQFEDCFALPGAQRLVENANRYLANGVVLCTSVDYGYARKIVDEVLCLQKELPDSRLFSGVAKINNCALALQAGMKIRTFPISLAYVDNSVEAVISALRSRCECVVLIANDVTKLNETILRDYWKLPGEVLDNLENYLTVLPSVDLIEFENAQA